ncbi:MAG: hypothetical protein J2P57_20570 [Acidimicrobiaceae bacterium]|nr:hypothetical protein [Acidimicrobiaceae bacterium]
MTLPRRAQTTLEIACAIVLGGVLGLLYWWWRHRPGAQPARRFRRASIAVVAVLMLAVGVGTVWRTTIALEHVSACTRGGAGVTVHRERDNPALFAEEAATWPETGLGLLYAKGVNAKVCLSSQSDYYVAVPADVVETSATTMGDIVLSPGFSDNQVRTAVASHEARHRTQWAIATAIGGPFAFPVAYAVDDFFFPGARNHFERLAGLEKGRYTPSGTGPILGPAQIAVLAGLGVVVVVVLLRARHRRGLARARTQKAEVHSA